MDDQGRFNEMAVRAIIRRAIELDDLAANSVDVSELRSIARSVGISEDAIDQAVREARGEEKRRRNRIRWLRYTRRVLSCLAAAVTAMTSTLMRVFLEQPAGLALMGAAAIPVSAIAVILIAYNRGNGSRRTFVFENIGIWASFTWATFLFGRSDPGLLVPGLIAWGVTTALGLVLIDSGDSEPPGLRREGIVQRVVQSLMQSGDDSGSTHRILLDEVLP